MSAHALRIGGVAATDLARAYGTPLLAIDTDVLDASLATFAALGATYDLDVAYAGKALLFVALVRRIAATPLALDVCSLGELLTAERGGMPPERLVLHGCAKTDAELDAAAAGRVGRVVVDNADELQRLAERARADRPVEVLVRVNSGIEAHTHAYVRTGGEDSKFGFAPASLDAAFDRVLAAPGLRAAGIHTHLGSQIFDPAPYAAAVPVVLDALAALAARGAPVRDLVLGGGFGVDAHAGGEQLDLGPALADVRAQVNAGATARGLAPPRLGIEPGRAVVARAGTSLYAVAALKYQGTRRFAIVDGGMADNPRPALYGAFHRPRLANRASAAAASDVTICGRSCENDRLVVAPLPDDLRSGDLIAMETTGAYTYSMASNYNRFPKPAVVFAGGGRHRLVVRREADADVVRNDVDDAL